MAALSTFNYVLISAAKKSAGANMEKGKNIPTTVTGWYFESALDKK